MMRRDTGWRCSFGAALSILALVGGLTACAPRSDGPAAVINAAPAERPPGALTVRRGQSLSGIAQTYHVPMRIIAEANHLSPPYRIQAGSTLIIPEIGQPAVPLVVAALPPTGAQDATQATTGPEPPGAPVYRPIPAPAENSSIAATPLSPPTALLPPPAGEPVAPAAKPAPPVPPAPPESSASNGAPSGRGSDAFLWPVRGRVLATYGSGMDGTHNDGINI